MAGINMYTTHSVHEYATAGAKKIYFMLLLRGGTLLSWGRVGELRHTLSTVETLCSEVLYYPAYLLNVVYGWSSVDTLRSSARSGASSARQYKAVQV